jgi:hypothetical protein
MPGSPPPRGDPFDLAIPGTDVTVKERLFGTAPEKIAGITSGRFADGRFLITVTAVGAAGNDSGTKGDTSPAGDRGDFDDPEDLDVDADWLFPAELAPGDLQARCPDVVTNRIGATPGLSDANLSVLNASAISFNYLTGWHLVGVAKKGPDKQFGGYAVGAWTRPAVNVSLDLDPEDTSEAPDADPDFTPQDVDEGGVFDADDLAAILDTDGDGNGPLAPKGVLLAASEEAWLTLARNVALVLPANYFALRNDAHGGNAVETNCEGFTPNQLRCDGSNPFSGNPIQALGALGWLPAPTGLVQTQLLYPLSVKDDYDGSLSEPIDPANLPQYAAPFPALDNGYRQTTAVTFYNARQMGGWATYLPQVAQPPVM